MKSDSLIKVTACVLSFSLILSTCVKTVSADTGAVIKSDKAIGGFDVVLKNCSNFEEIVYTDNVDMASYAAAVIENIDNNGEDTSNNEAIAETSQEQTGEVLTGEEEPVTTEAAEPVSEYANTGISVAETYVNVRTEPNTDSEVRGKLYKGCAATILENNGEWVKISSGSVEGYIKTEFLAIGFSAEELINTYATKYATVVTRTLNVRKLPDNTSKILTQVPEGETYSVCEESDEWVKISIDDGDIEGYLSKEYVSLDVKFQQAVSIEEEQAEIAAEIERQKKAEEVEKEAQRLADAKAKADADAKAKADASKNTNKSTDSSSSSAADSSSSTSSSGGSSSVASFALQYVGNRYIYGGSSLTNGTDCSGFTQSVYRNFGYSLGRSSRDQYASAGTIVSMDSLQSGDLLFYTNSSGVVNHVAIYIGNGQIVHASNSKDGIKVSKYNYRTPCRARRVIN